MPRRAAKSRSLCTSRHPYCGRECHKNCRASHPRRDCTLEWLAAWSRDSASKYPRSNSILCLPITACVLFTMLPIKNKKKDNSALVRA